MPVAVSVVIGANGRFGSVFPCLEALACQLNPPRAEVILAAALPSLELDGIRERFPDVHVIPFPPPTTLARLRQAGINKARGEIIALIDPFTVVPEGWLGNLARAHERLPNLAIGGPVGLHPRRTGELSAWAVFLNEYASFLPPCRAGPSTMLPGCNLSYKRAAWERVRAGGLPGGFWKAFFNFRIEELGEALWLEPALEVLLDKPIPFRAFLRTRFDHGRCFAALRGRSLSRGMRPLRALSTPLLPLLFICRHLAVLLPKKSFTGKVLLTLPHQLLLFAAWAAGELAGYAFGDGVSCGRLYE